MEQTAVEWFSNEISEIIGKVPFSKEQEEKLIYTLEKAKEIEKKQIERAFMFGQYTVSIENGEQYYNETFKNK